MKLFLLAIIKVIAVVFSFYNKLVEEARNLLLAIEGKARPKVNNNLTGVQRTHNGLDPPEVKREYKMIKLNIQMFASDSKKKNSINDLINYLFKARYVLKEPKVAEIDHLGRIGEVDFVIKKITSNKDMLEVIEQLKPYDVTGLNLSSKNLYKDVYNGPIRTQIRKYEGLPLLAVRRLIYAKENAKTWTDGTWKDKETVLKFLGLVDRNMETNEAFIEEQYSLHHEIYGEMNKVSLGETSFPYENDEIISSKTLLQSIVTHLKNESPVVESFYESPYGSRYAKVSITMNRHKEYIYVPAERGGVILSGGNTLVMKRYKRNDSNFKPLELILRREVKTIQKLSTMYELPLDYFAKRMQNLMFGILYSNQQIKEYKYSAYSLVGVRHEQLNTFNTRLELHKEYEPESVYPIDIEKFSEVSSHKQKGLLDYKQFQMNNAWLKHQASDFVTTRADNKVLYFENNKLPISYYTIGEENATRIGNGSRLAMGTNMIASSMPLRINNETVFFDTRLVRPTDMPKTWGKRRFTDLGYYFWTVDMFFEDSSGNIAHEGARLFSKHLKDRINAGYKFDTGMGDKGAANFLDDELYTYHYGEKIDLSIFVHHDTPGRNNLASTSSGLNDAKMMLGDNIKEVFTIRDGIEVSLGFQAIAYTYFYHTDKTRGSLSPYGEVADMPVYEPKKYIDKVRVGQDTLTKLAQLGMHNTIEEFFGGKLNDILDLTKQTFDSKVEVDLATGQKLYGKYGKITRMLQPLTTGMHNTALPNRLIPMDEIHVVASKEHAISISKAFNVNLNLDSSEPQRVAYGISSRHPMIRKSNMMYSKLYIRIIEDNTPGYAYPYYLVNPFVHALMDGDFDGDETFFYQLTNSKAIKEVYDNLHASQYEFKNIGHFNSYHREWTNGEDYISYLEEVKGKKFPENYKTVKDRVSLKLDAAPMQLTTMLSKELIGRAKGPIMKFELHLTAFLAKHNLLDHYGKDLQALIQKLNETFTQPTISMQKWTDDLDNALRLMYQVTHLGRFLSIISDGLIDNTKSHYFTNFYLLNETNTFKNLSEAISTFKKGADFKLPFYKDVMNRFGYKITNYLNVNDNLELELSNTHLRLVDPSEYFENIKDYISNHLVQEIKDLSNLQPIPENFYDVIKKKRD